MIKHASIVPLIGGETIAQTNVFGSKPDYILSYSPFKANDSHILNYYAGTPYILLDEGGKHPHKVDVVNAVCPCAGLSALSQTSSSNSSMNNWMYESATYVMSQVKPAVFWGENAPRLGTKAGAPVVEKLRAIGKANGYVMSIYKTKSIIHGLSQVRDRTFYFFWKGTSIPIFDYIDETKNHEKIEDTILQATKFGAKHKKDKMSGILANGKVPSHDAFYRYVLEVIEGGKSHKQFSESLTRTANVLDTIETNGHTYFQVAEWLKKNKFEREAQKAIRMGTKLKSGGNIMRKHIEVPKDYIGAFVGHMPGMLTHPIEDRYLNIRECLSIMAMPTDFELLNHSRSLNHICQNVPVKTAEFAARMVYKYLDKKLDLVESKFLIQDNKAQRIEINECANSNLDSFLA